MSVPTTATDPRVGDHRPKTHVVSLLTQRVGLRHLLREVRIVTPSAPTARLRSMMEPVSAIGMAVAKAAAGAVGSRFGKAALEWAQGSEARRLVKLLESDFPNAGHMLVQPDVLGELYLYAETGELDQPALRRALSPIAADEEEADRLVEAVRARQWRAMRDDRRTHFEFLRLRAELRGDVEQHAERVIERLDDIVARLGRRLPAVRQLPAAIERFVDRISELEQAEAALQSSTRDDVPRMICFAGMPGLGKSMLALEVARRHEAEFEAGTLYVDLRAPDGGARTPSDVAHRLLRDLGVAAEAISPGDGAVGQLRSLLSEIAVLLVLDNATREEDVRALIPAASRSAVLITSRTPLVRLGDAQIIVLQPFADADAIELLTGFVGDRAQSERDATAAIAGVCHGLPLAVAVLGARLRRRPKQLLSIAATELGTSLRAIDDPAETIRATLTSGIDELSSPARRAILLAAEIEIADIAPASLAAAADIGETEARVVLEELEDRQVVKDGGLHQLVRSALKELAASELTEEEVTSAQQRRVAWLVESARPHFEDLGG